MSGTKLKILVLCCVLFSVIQGVTWDIGSEFSIFSQEDPLYYAMHPASYPDSFCVASIWTPTFAGFHVQETMIYAAGSKFDLSLTSQFHCLMSNHMLSLGFPILKESHIHAGLQFHYVSSLLYQQDVQHKFSCSGGVILEPDSSWCVSFYSRHLLHFPQDSVESTLEAISGICIEYRLIPQFMLSASLQKRVFFSWDFLIAAHYDPWPLLSCYAAYELSEGNLYFGFSLKPGHWKFQYHAECHRYLGIVQKFVIAYEF